MPSIDINALLVAHGGLVPPHHVEVDVPDGTYAGLVRITGKRAVVEGAQLRKLAVALPGKVRVLYAVGDEPKPKRTRKNPLRVIADPTPAQVPEAPAPSVLDDW